MARKRKPTELHLVTGTTNVTRHRDRKNEPKPKGGPIRPKHLLPNELAVWDEYLSIAFWLTSADTEIFALWCQITANEVRRHEEKDAEGKVVVVGGPSSMDSARISEYRRMCQELAFTPGSRSKVSMKDADAPKDESAQFYA